MEFCRKFLWQTSAGAYLMKDKQPAMVTIKLKFKKKHTHTQFRFTNNTSEMQCMAPAHNLNEVAIFQCKTATNDTNLVFGLNE